MTRLRRNEEKTKSTDSRHCEACQIEWTNLLVVVASRSKLNFATAHTFHVEPLTIIITNLMQVRRDISG